MQTGEQTVIYSKNLTEYINPMYKEIAKNFSVLKQVVHKITTVLWNANSINQSPGEADSCSSGL